MAVGVAQGFGHPLAQAVVRAARDLGARLSPVDAGACSVAGKGVAGAVDNQEVAPGNARLPADMGVACSRFAADADARRDLGETALSVAVDGEVAGFLGLAAETKGTVPDADGDDLGGIVRARRLAVATVRNVRQSLFFAFAHSSVGIPVAAGGLYPFTGVPLPPMPTAAATGLSLVSGARSAPRRRVPFRTDRRGWCARHFPVTSPGRDEPCASPAVRP